MLAIVRTARDIKFGIADGQLLIGPPGQPVLEFSVERIFFFNGINHVAATVDGRTKRACCRRAPRSGRPRPDRARALPRALAHALMDLAKPMFLLPLALASRAEQIGAGFAAALAPGTGLACAHRVLVVGLEGPALERFCASASRALADSMAGQAKAVLARCDGSTFLRRPGGPRAASGPAALVVACCDLAQLRQVAMSLQA